MFKNKSDNLMWTMKLSGSNNNLALCENLVADSCLSSSLFEEDEHQDIWTLELFFADEEIVLATVAAIQRLCELNNFNVSMHSPEKLPEKDWLAENRASFKPIEVGQFFIHSSFHQPHISDNKISLEINASQAFGTGAHATTSGCLMALEYLQQQQFNNILDLGTGSGILAMAAAALFKCPVIATDIDPIAVDVARENVLKNQYDHMVSCAVSDGFANKTMARGYDLIIANILAGPLIELSADICQRVADRGFVVLSGLLQEQALSVLEAYQRFDMALQKQYILQNWSVLILNKRN